MVGNFLKKNDPVFNNSTSKYIAEKLKTDAITNLYGIIHNSTFNNWNMESIQMSIHR